MCLYTKQKKVKIAKKPITIYKYLKCECLPGLNSVRYETPYTHTKVSGDIIDGKKSMEASGIEFFEQYDGLYFISTGFIHGFSSKQKALECIMPNGCVLFECEIPAGVEYYRSLSEIESKELIEGVITKNYSPKDDSNIKEGERVFYTHENAMIIDTIRKAIDDVPESYKKFFLAPLLYEASVHANTSGVFKGFYKSKKSNVGKFGGEGANALERITGKIELKKPVLSEYSCQVTLFKEDANVLVKHLRGLDITYIDPPYNQHPYGSNYFMLNTIIENKLGHNISDVAGIPDDWNKSDYNKKSKALTAFEELVKDIDSKYLIISYNNEGFITLDEMQTMLQKYGELTTKEIDYVAFRGSRNLKDRNTHTTEYIFVLKKAPGKS